MSLVVLFNFTCCSNQLTPYTYPGKCIPEQLLYIISSIIGLNSSSSWEFIMVTVLYVSIMIVQFPFIACAWNMFLLIMYAFAMYIMYHAYSNYNV